MDHGSFNQVGRYGTLALMKHNELNTCLTAFGIDAEELTFGRDPSCGVRLYYSDVSLVHCKIVFEERKAFLVVLGASGLLVDGCKVFPNGSQSPYVAPTTIPLTNNSEFEIHGKRFRFTYPPKELRETLLATPPHSSNRVLRLSMIQSAQVFSPRPSHDPRENLRILQSPLKNTFKTSHKPTFSFLPRTNLFAFPMPPTTDLVAGAEEQEEQDDIILVNGDHPQVVEDERDLVILEHVEASIPSRTSSPNNHLHTPVTQQPPQTPVRSRSLPRNTLHRAVLIRSAQRAVMKAEQEMEEEEEMEVLQTVADEIGDVSDEDVVKMEETESDEDEVSEEEGEVEESEGSLPQKLTWKKSLERLWPFRSSSPSPEKDDDAEEGGESQGSDNSSDEGRPENYEERDESDDVAAPLPSESYPTTTIHTPIRKPLGLFMTPQVHKQTGPSTNGAQWGTGPMPERGQPLGGNTSVGLGRYSLGEARRVVKTEQVWKVRDIVVPEPDAPSQTRMNSLFTGPGVRGLGGDAVASPSRSTRTVVDEEERKAIKERRRSALREVDSFFPGGVPGMGSPAGLSSSSSSSRSSSSFASSPVKPFSPLKSKREGEGNGDEVDTRSLFEKMKETVEGMKRRRSLAPPVTPARSANASGEGRASLRLGVRPGSPSKAPVGVMDVAEEEEKADDVDGDKENTIRVGGYQELENEEDEEPAFSLLRPGVLEEMRAEEEQVDVPILDTEEEHWMVEKDDGTADFIPVLVGPAAGQITVEELRPEKGGRPKSRTRATPIPEMVVVDEADHEEGGNASKLPARKTRAPKRVVDDDDAELWKEGTLTATKPPSKRGRKPTVEPEDKNGESHIHSTTKRGRKATSSEIEEHVVAPLPARRGRKPTTDTEEEPQKEKGAGPARRGRKVAATMPAEVENITEDPAPVPVPARRGVRKTAPTEIELEEVEKSESQPMVRRGRTAKVVTEVVPVRGRAATRGKSNEAGSRGPRRGTKTKSVVNDSGDLVDAVEVEEEPVQKPKVGRKKVIKEEVEDTSNLPNAGTWVPGAKPGIIKTPAMTKSRATKKTPATAPASMVQQGIDKENTPGSDRSSIVDVEEVVKVRVSRTTARKAVSGTVGRPAKVKEEVEAVAVEPEITKGRVMRATRARTRT